MKVVEKRGFDSRNIENNFQQYFQGARKLNFWVWCWLPEPAPICVHHYQIQISSSIMDVIAASEVSFVQ